MSLTGARKVYEKFGLADVMAEELRLIELGLESSLSVIVQELCFRSVEKHLDSDLILEEVIVDPHPLAVVIILQGTLLSDAS